MVHVFPDMVDQEMAPKNLPQELFRRAKIELAKTLVFKIYLVLTTICFMIEPVLVGFPPHGIVLQLQIIILSVTSFLFFVGVVMVVNFYPDDVEEVELSAQFRDVVCSEFFVEFAGLVLGWSLIFIFPGLAALRCIRLFRLFWWYELLAPEYGNNNDSVQHNVNFWIIIKSCIKYLRKLGDEIFSAKSRGGAVILTMFFYVTYLFSVVFWVEKGYIVTPDTGYENGYVCGTLPLCFITMMRLALYDGTGFDYFTAVALEGHKDSYGFATLAIIYTIFAAMILLNGLIGIFGHAFADDEEEEEEERKLIILQESGMLSNTRINRITH